MTDSYESAVAVTESDTVSFAKTRALWVGGVGDLAVVMADGRAVTTLIIALY